MLWENRKSDDANYTHCCWSKMNSNPPSVQTLLVIPPPITVRAKHGFIEWKKYFIPTSYLCKYKQFVVSIQELVNCAACVCFAACLVCLEMDCPWKSAIKIKSSKHNTFVQAWIGEGIVPDQETFCWQKEQTGFDKRCLLCKTADAFRYFEQGHAQGKVVIAIVVKE